MAQYRLSYAAQTDILDILAWTDEQFGAEARIRYEKLLVAALRDAASSTNVFGRVARPEWGEGTFSWHLSLSRDRSSGGPVHRPRHFLMCRREQDLLVIGRILHDAMDVHRYLDEERMRD